MRHRALYRFDQELKKSFEFIAGIDEAGRGPIAGPVVVAAVILSYKKQIEGLYDSKLLTPSVREKIYDEILKDAVSFGVGVSSEKRIDRNGIMSALFSAAKKAIKKLSPPPDIVLFDGNHKIPELNFRQMNIVKGDRKSACVAAASIIAKVTRDRMMKEYALKFPAYNFESHKGYGTSEHYKILREIGPSSLHRVSFLKNL